MTRVVLVALVLSFLSSFPAGEAFAATKPSDRVFCADNAASKLPKRPRGSRTGSSFVEGILAVGGAKRDRMVAEQVLMGNIPDFLRAFVPVTLSGEFPGQGEVSVTICVSPDYLAVGDDEDFVRVPLGLPTAAGLADAFGYLLPTSKMVDAIHAQASLRLTPEPMSPTPQMESTDYFWRHDRAVERQRSKSHVGLGDLTAGQKKDIVLTNRLRSKPGRVAIYGWHRPNGKPIQPLSTVHQANYADYSHGLRFVGPVALVNGVPMRLSAILQDPTLARIVSSEGAIPEPDRLLNRLH